MTRRKNFVGQVTPSIIDTEYEQCNFSQPQPVDVGGGVYEGVRIFPGDDTPRSFTECNLTNCEMPPGSTIVRSNGTIRQTGLVSGTETVTIDGEDIEIVHHVNRVHARRMPDGSYEYKQTPEDIEVD